MKKIILKGAIVAIVFFAALVIISEIMNKGNTDMTTEMGKAVYPLVSVEYGGFEINAMHGYAKAMEVGQMRDSITPLASGRKISMCIETYGNSVSEISYEVRSVDGQRLIENTKIPEFLEDQGKIRISFALKDLIENNQEYLLVLLLKTGSGQEIRYYTRVISPEEYYVSDKLEYISDFSAKTFDKEKAKELTKYLESNAEGDNTTFGRVTIHSSFQQVTWGDLKVKRNRRPGSPLRIWGPLQEIL